MPVPQLPYKRPFFTITLNPHEIEVREHTKALQAIYPCFGSLCAAPSLACLAGQLRAGSPAHLARLAPATHHQEDLALIITNTKRAGRMPRRQTPPPERHAGRAGEREER